MGRARDSWHSQPLALVSQQIIGYSNLIYILRYYFIHAISRGISETPSRPMTRPVGERSDRTYAHEAS